MRRSASRASPLLAGLLLLTLAPAATGSPEAPAVVTLVLDTSGSLGAADIARSRELALGILAGLSPGSEVAVFTFDDQARLVLPRTSQPERVRGAVSAVRIQGRYTALHDALYDAGRYLRDGPAGRKAIVLITDGKDENSTLDLDDGLTLAQDARVPVVAVGVGRVEERVLRRIAKLTGGQYIPAPQARAAAIAARIMAQAPATEEPREKDPGATPREAAVTRHASASASNGSLVTLPSREMPRSGPRGRATLWAGLGVLLVGAGSIVVFALRRRSRPRCPRCSRPLPDPLSTCAFCLSGNGDHARGDRTLRADLSPTVVSRLNITEEFLEKTVSLRERPVLSITKGPGAGELLELNRESATSIGRAKANDIVLLDVAVSSQHCRIRPEEGRFVLHDLKSTNGTFVNDRRVNRHELTDGDLLQLGETFLHFRTEHRRA